ncbi:sensor histidine kinase [Kitasatospora sp. NPDC008115]|uniref:sensor histidine kinase n=1 Tax=Kitasatospora sp. NPDC008115 TaxID=3364022 RepID=UPI0036EC0D87
MLEQIIKSSGRADRRPTNLATGDAAAPAPRGERNTSDRIGRLVSTLLGLATGLGAAGLPPVQRRRPVPATAAPPGADTESGCPDAAARLDERRRLRRELHDSLAPRLAALHMRMELAGLDLSDDAEQAPALLAQAREDISTAIADVRQVIRNLDRSGPGTAESAGTLRQFLDRQVHVFEQAGAGRLRFVTELPTVLDDFPADVQTELKKISGEAVANVARHARASVCRISASVGSGGLNLSIEDDGIGISADAVGGIGLPSMCVRTRELGGVFSVAARTPHGTAVRVRLPHSALADGTGRLG